MSDLEQITKDLAASANDLQGYMVERGIERNTQLHQAWVKLEMAILEIRKESDNEQS